MKKLASLLLAATLLLAACAQPASAGSAAAPGGTPGADKKDWPKKMVLVQIPNEADPQTPSLHKQFREHLSKELGIPVEEVEGSAYASAIEAISAGKIDAMVVSPMSYYQAKTKGGAEMLARAVPSPDYYSVFIARANDDSIKTLADMKGKNYAFVDPASSSGYLYPKGTLVQKLQLDPDKVEQSGYYFKNVAYSGKHDTSVIGVAMGDYDCAGVAGSVLENVIKAGLVKEGSIKIIDRSVDIPSAVYVIRGNLPSSFKDAVKKAFTSFSDPTYFKALYKNEKTRFEAVDESYYTPSLEMFKAIHALEATSKK